MQFLIFSPLFPMYLYFPILFMYTGHRKNCKQKVVVALLWHEWMNEWTNSYNSHMFSLRVSHAFSSSLDFYWATCRVTKVGGLWGASPVIKGSCFILEVRLQRFQSHATTCPGSALAPQHRDYSPVLLTPISLPLPHPSFLLYQVFSRNFQSLHIIPYIYQTLPNFIYDVIETLTTVVYTFLWETQFH